MKKILKMIVMVLVASISVIAAANAQYRRPAGNTSGPIGSGLYSIDVQRAEEVGAVEQTSYAAIFGSIDDARRIFRSDLSNQGMSCDQIIDLQSKWIASQLGGKFDPSRPSDYTVTYEVVGPDFWNIYEDGYIIASQGSTLRWCDPRTSSVHRNRTQWVVMTITDNATGLTAKLLCNCGNPIRLKEKPAGYDETVNKTAYQSGPGTSAKAEASVVVHYEPNPIQPPVPYVSPYATPVLEKKKGGCTACYIIGGALLAGGVTYAILSGGKKDNTYSNTQPGHQGGSAPSGTSGGTGTQQTWASSYGSTMSTGGQVGAPHPVVTIGHTFNLNWFRH